MRIEQVCRFRVESGYQISAKTDTIDNLRDGAAMMHLGNVFNDAMHPLFDRMGQSIFTCLPEGNDVFLAQCTLRSDIHGRSAMFTHSYIISRHDYTEIVAKNSAPIYIEVSKMLDTQGSITLPSVDPNSFLKSSQSAFSLQELRTKYQLDDKRYSVLLQQAYQSITGGGPLCIRTNRSISETAQLIQEFVYCIFQGLLPSLRSSLSYSSGPDTRMNVCVLSSDCGRLLQATPYNFPEKSDGTESLSDKGNMQLFQELASASNEDRVELLNSIQTWLDDILEDSSSLSMKLIEVAYAVFKSSSLDASASSYLINSLLNSVRGGKLRQDEFERTLLTLMQNLDEAKICPDDVLGQLLEYDVTHDASEDFKKLFERLLTYAPVKTCSVLFPQMMSLQQTPRVKELILCFMSILPESELRRDPSVTQQLVTWIIRDDIQTQIEKCIDIIAPESTQAKCTFAESIINQADIRIFNSNECAMLNYLIGCVIEDRSNEQVVLSDQACTLLNKKYAEYEKALLSETYASYLVSVRYGRNAPVSRMLPEFENLKLDQPKLFKKVEQEMAASKDPSPIWEDYQTATVFQKGTSIGFIGLMDICEKHNQFKTSYGPFEQKFIEIWVECIKNVTARIRHSDELVQELNDVLEKTEITNVSSETKKKIRKEVGKTFWHKIDEYDLVEITADDGFPIKDFVGTAGMNDIRYEQFYRLVRESLVGSIVTQEFRRYLEKLDISERTVAQDAIGLLVEKIFQKTKNLNWDYLLLYCLSDDKESHSRQSTYYDFDFLIENKLKKMAIEFQEGGFSYKDFKLSPLNSITISTDPDLRKQFHRALSRFGEPLLQMMADDLVRPKRGDRNFGQRVEENERRRDKGFFSPFSSDRKKGEGRADYKEPFIETPYQKKKERDEPLIADVTQHNNYVRGDEIKKARNENYISPYDPPVKDTQGNQPELDTPVKEEVASIVSKSLHDRSSQVDPLHEIPNYEKNKDYPSDRVEQKQVDIIIDEPEPSETPAGYEPHIPSTQVPSHQSVTPGAEKQVKSTDYEIVPPKDPKRGKRVDEENSGFFKRAKKGLKGLTGRGKE